MTRNLPYLTTYIAFTCPTIISNIKDNGFHQFLKLRILHLTMSSLLLSAQERWTREQPLGTLELAFHWAAYIFCTNRE